MKCLMYRIIISLSCIILIQNSVVSIEYVFGNDKVRLARSASSDPFLKPENTGEEGGHVSEANILFTIDEADKKPVEDVVEKNATEKKKKRIVRDKKKEKHT